MKGKNSMPKISAIVPVYNTSKYLEKCLDSILNQKMQDFEIIIVNDGSTDNSEQIIEKYKKIYTKKIKTYTKKNGGLSDARNYGVKKAEGEYLCFIDSDDYIENNLFSKLENYMIKKPDLIKYKCIKVNENNEVIDRIDGPIFQNKTGEEAFNELCFKDILMETAWLYMYRSMFFKEKAFEFPTKRYHEDWAIVPYIVTQANIVTSIDFFGYYYVQSANSITRNNDDEKIYKRATDMLYHYDNIIKKIEKSNLKQNTIDNFKRYMSNCLILKIEELPSKFHKQYIKQIRDKKIIKNIKPNNLKQLIKKLILNVNIKLYLKIR